jgi:MFS family permease
VEAVRAQGGRPGRAAGDGALWWTAATAWAATVVLVALALVLLARNGPAPSFGRIVAAYGQRTVAATAGASCTLAFATVGTIVVRYRRRHLVGWLFCLVGLSLAVQAFASFYATHALVAAPGSLPGGRAMGWLGTCVSAPALLLIPLFCFLLFPDGRLPSPRWRLVAWLDGLILAVTTVALAVRPGPLVVVPSAANPLGAPGAVGRLAGGLLDAVALLLPFAVAASVAALVVRLRRARGAQRQQLKWFASTAALVAAVGIPVLPAQVVAPPAWANAALVVWVIAIAFLPVAAGIAILRHRLFDIDVLLNRALVYSTVTTVLGACYAGIVVAVGAVLSGGRPGGGEVPPLAVALATLVVAAVFQPARRRVQDVVDRRFNRRRYDAQRTAAAFAAQLRQQTDLDTLVTELVAVVDRTMEPTQVSLWLRPTLPFPQSRPQEAPRPVIGRRAGTAARRGGG